jgi:hypothetical protein
MLHVYRQDRTKFAHALRRQEPTMPKQVAHSCRPNYMGQPAFNVHIKISFGYIF